MKDLQHILRRIADLDAARTPYALATVVEVEGSAYRGPGTRMLVESLEKSQGTISGGCLEGDVREQAVRVLEDGQPRLLYYDSTLEDDILWGTGLGCSGAVRVLVERMPAPEGPHVPDYLRASACGQSSAALATVFDCEGDTLARPGQHLAVCSTLPDGGDIADDQLRQLVRAEMDAQLAVLAQTRRPAGVTRRYEWAQGCASVLVETLLPPLQLVVFGAGYDAAPIVRLASELGWRVGVVDHRPSYARAERFPEARQVLLAAPGQWPDDLEMDEHSAALVMTHNYLQDQSVLRHMLPRAGAYLGVLGPRQRTQRLVDELASEGVKPASPLAFFSPMGLDIGAETAEEIALSIVAEIQASLLGRSGGHLRLRQGPIHDRRQ